MKWKLTCIAFLVLTSMAYAQPVTQWTEADRKYLVENLTRSRDEILKETAGLSKAQWSFKESPDRWSISQVVEHICIWEILMDNDNSRALRLPEQPQFVEAGGKDSDYSGFIMEEKKHHAEEYTKPYTYAIPMGLNELKSNEALFTKLRNESIDYVSKTKENLRVHFLKEGEGSVHQTMIVIFGHADRHLRQIKKVKQHPNYPKS